MCVQGERLAQNVRVQVLALCNRELCKQVVKLQSEVEVRRAHGVRGGQTELMMLRNLPLTHYHCLNALSHPSVTCRNQWEHHPAAVMVSVTSELWNPVNVPCFECFSSQTCPSAPPLRTVRVNIVGVMLVC